MKDRLVKNIADAVLYEGYLLYPYRPSAVKNQQRWNFGALCPESYSYAQAGTESWTMQTQVLVETSPKTTLNVKVRFLHLLMREVAREGQFVPPLQEAVEREVCLPVSDLSAGPFRLMFTFPAAEQVEPILDEKTRDKVGLVTRRQQGIAGALEVCIEDCTDRLQRITVQIFNLTRLADAKQKTRDDALMRSFVSTHTILSVENGQFVSLLDPPEAFQKSAAACSNVGTYPVLVGEEGERDCMLSSPIILYDYPQIASESAGNLFDGTEIDEILTLRIMTLTDDEKREMRSADDRAREILERTETLPVEQLMKMHGAMKGLNRKTHE